MACTTMIRSVLWTAGIALVFPSVIASAFVVVHPSISTAYKYNDEYDCLSRAFVPTAATTTADGSSSSSSMCMVASSTSSSSGGSTSAVAVEERGRLILDKMSDSVSSAREWGEQFGYESGSAERSFFALFAAIRTGGSPGLGGEPFVLTQESVLDALRSSSGEGESGGFEHFFTFADLEQALEDDFLDADRGSTDNRKGWRVTGVSEARGQSFESARMTYSDVQAALEKGTVIFNAIGAHIPTLASATLACTDGTSLPAAVNMYITAPNRRTSAPPHTDRQDVVVVQTQGSKRWRVFAPPDASNRPSADVFARGKGEDNLPLHRLLENAELLLLDTTLHPGDVLFIPAGFPHTTDTIVDGIDDTSVHLTFGMDTHVWDLDYLSLRRFALRKAGVQDTKCGQTKDEDNRYVGDVNMLPEQTRLDLFSSLPMGLLDELSDDTDGPIATSVIQRLRQISHDVDAETAQAAEQIHPDIWADTVLRIKQQGIILFDIHRDMYLAAIAEGEARRAEEAMSAHLTTTADDDTKKSTTMTQERMQRLSLFRVKRFYDQIAEIKADLTAWSHDSLVKAPTTTTTTNSVSSTELPDNWEFTLPLQVGDSVEADLGGALFPAQVTRVNGDDMYDVQFFDGDAMDGLERGMIKLLTPPAQITSPEENDTSLLTKKELKRLRKKQEKMARKQNKNQ